MKPRGLYKGTHKLQISMIRAQRLPMQQPGAAPPWRAGQEPALRFHCNPTLAPDFCRASSFGFTGQQDSLQPQGRRARSSGGERRRPLPEAPASLAGAEKQERAGGGAAPQDHAPSRGRQSAAINVNLPLPP